MPIGNMIVPATSHMAANTIFSPDHPHRHEGLGQSLDLLDEAEIDHQQEGVAGAR